MVDVKFRSEIQSYLGRNAIISNGGATVTCTHTQGGWDIAKTSKVFSSGKIYYEITVGATGSGLIVGICLPHANVFNRYLGQGNIEGIGWENNNSIHNSGMGAVAGGSYSSTNVLRFCVDLTNNRYWVAVGAGNWNSNGSADPATNTGGSDLSTLFTNKKLFCIAVAMQQNSAVTINGGNYAAFTYSVPSGFTAADSVTAKEMWNYSGVSYGTKIDAFNCGTNVLFTDDCFVSGLSTSSQIWNTALTTKPLDSSSGKVYFECLVAHRGNYIAVGLASYNSNFANYPGGSDSNGVSWHAGGGVAGPNMVGAGAFSADNVGAILRVAFDVPNKKIWVALNDGPWDNNVAHDPATNTGGGDMTTLISNAYGNIVYAAVGVGRHTDFIRCNFGALSDFVYDVPSGFTSLDAAPAAPVVSTLRVTMSKLEYAFPAESNARITKVMLECANNYASTFYLTQCRMEVAVKMTATDLPTGTQSYFVT